MSGEAYVLETAVDPGKLAPGVYAAVSASEAYGTLAGLVALGQAELLGDTQLLNGGRAISVRLGRMRANAQGSITIGAEFFATAKNDYRNWREKHVREAVQNSVDAGATRVAITTAYLDADGRPASDAAQAQFIDITYDDDGGGMDEDTLLNKFLVLGGTGKRSAAGSVGGFGKAKELLILPWVAWRIETQDLVVEGHGIQYDTKRVPMRRGTKLTVRMTADECTDVSAAIAFVKKCYLPHVQFTVNGERVKADLKVGELVHQIGNMAAIYYDKRKSKFDAQVMFVRVNGMYMHERWLAEGITGTVVVELLGKSTDLLTANRDGIREYTLGNELDKFVNRIAADTKSALKKKRNLVHEIYVGEKFEAKAQRVQASILDTLGDVEPRGKRGKQMFIGEDRAIQVAEILVTLGAAGDVGEQEDEDAPLRLRPPAEAAMAMMETPLIGARQVELIAQHFAWTPSFMVHNEDEEFSVTAKFRPEKMAPGLRKLARFWAELCRFVLIQLSSSARYGVGWIFDRDVGAQHRSEEDGHWLLLNPFVDGNLPSRDAPLGKGAELLQLSNPDHVNWLYAAAVHECTHLADGITQHNESFAAALTRNVARTANRGKQIEKIRKSIVARAAADKPTKRREQIPLGELREVMPAFEESDWRGWKNWLQQALDSYATEQGSTMSMRDVRTTLGDLGSTYQERRDTRGLVGDEYVGIAEAHDDRSGRLIAYWIVKKDAERKRTVIWDRDANALRVDVAPKEWWDEWFGGESRTWR
jgi:hypothetical protein